MQIRRAILEDLPQVTDVILAGARTEHFWSSFLPSKKIDHQAYADDLSALLREKLSAGFSDCDIEVVDLASAGQAPDIVSVAIWDAYSPHGNGNEAAKSLYDDDVSESAVGSSNIDAYAQVVEEARLSRFGCYRQHRFLQLLTTHPVHQRQGYAKHLVKSAIVDARRHGCILTTIGGPFGYVFFSGLGFRDLGPVTVRGGAGKEAQYVKAMSLVVEEERRPSLVDSLRGLIRV